VVGEKEFLIVMINRYYCLPTTSPFGYSTPSGSPVIGGEQFPGGGELGYSVVFISFRTLS
jgi:hypothetical protein